MDRPWLSLPIRECGESIVHLPSSLICLQPHPYLSIGAPYGKDHDPFSLRNGVVQRLVSAQSFLQRNNPQIRLAIFDAWRPISVQKFMVNYSIEKECKENGINLEDPSRKMEVDQIVRKVEKFWAKASFDISTPPPHSTGAAVDLTLSDLDGKPLNMGGHIDEMGPVSEPDHYAAFSRSNKNSKEFVWNKRRLLLSGAMKASGFVQHPNEWWHFSYGDQLWAWTTNSFQAIYGLAGPH